MEIIDKNTMKKYKEKYNGFFTFDFLSSDLLSLLKCVTALYLLPTRNFTVM